jgi:hypothetical protein
MSDNNTETNPNGSQEPGDERTDRPHWEGGEAPKGNREARYRTERNEARAERDALAARVEQLQARELERIASKSLSNPADLLRLSGKSLEDFIGEDGELDAELVTEAANELLGSRPGLRPNAAAVDPTQGHGNNAGKGAPSWGALLTP